MTSLHRSIVRDSVLVTLLGLAGHALGLGLTILVASSFGTSREADADYLAFVLPGMLMAILGGVLKIVFIPIFVQERLRDPESARLILGGAIGWMGLLSLGGMLLLGPLALTPLLSFGAEAEATRLCRHLFFELLPLVPLTIATAVVGAAYNAYQRFGLAEVAQASRYAVAFLTVLLLHESIGIHSLPLGHALGQTVALMLSLWALRTRVGLVLRPAWSFHPALARMLRLSLFPFLGYAVAQATPMISRFITAALPEGNVSALSYAEKLSALPALALGTGFTSVLVSHWAKLEAEGGTDEMGSSLHRVLSSLLLILVPLALLLAFLRHPLIAILLQRGSFDAASAAQTANLFAILVAATVPQYLYMTLTRIPIAKGKTFLPFLLATITALSHGFLAWLFALYLGWGAWGVAVSLLVSLSLVTLILLVVIHLRYVAFTLRPLLVDAARVAAGAAALVCVFLILPPGEPGGGVHSILWPALLRGMLAACVYAAIVLFAQHPEALALRRKALGLLHTLRKGSAA